MDNQFNKPMSYWLMTAEGAEYPVLEKSLDTEVLIIGGGITGITCAYTLAKKGLKPVVIEAETICCGTTGKTTGKITSQHSLIYSVIDEKYGREYARLYASSQQEAVDFVKHVAAQESIDCQLRESTAYLYASMQNDIQVIKKEYETAVAIGIDCQYIDKPDFPKHNFGMLAFSGQAVFHPVRYVLALAKLASSLGAVIYCGTKAIKVKDGDTIHVQCENGHEIHTKHLVMATQYPIYDGPNLFYTRLYAKRSYGIAVKTKADWPDGSYINVSGRTRSIRTHIENGDRVLIVVGEDHPTGRSDVNMDERFVILRDFADSIAGVDRILARWSAQDYDTPDMIPYIGRISDDSRIYVASGYKKWGLSTGTLAGLMIPELIEQGSCRYEELYSRIRPDFTRSAVKTITEVGQSVLELIKSKLEKSENLSDVKPGEGRVIRFDGKKAGIYRDKTDRVIILDISCTHMSTELNYNSAEKTWDCPAHGGRYSLDGKLLEGPPKNPLKILYQGSFSDLIEK
jgi:glycine/D-amino acid oxidase-like deaminating enzyme/nitrite reductase/ring-hydroxylating ferredoxin subunit